MSAHPDQSSECGCSPEWRKPKPNGTCATCGGWLPGGRSPSLTAMWRGSRSSVCAGGLECREPDHCNPGDGVPGPGRNPSKPNGERRWTLYGRPMPGIDGPEPPKDGVEVMPVSEHEQVRAAVAALHAYLWTGTPDSDDLQAMMLLTKQALYPEYR